MDTGLIFWSSAAVELSVCKDEIRLSEVSVLHVGETAETAIWDCVADMLVGHTHPCATLSNGPTMQKVIHKKVIAQ